MYENDFRLYRGVVATSPDELYHHGRKGQKWGVHNGPPYPLRRGQASAAEKRAGWKSVVDTAEAVKKGIKKASSNIKEASDNAKNRRYERRLDRVELKKKVKPKKEKKALRKVSDESINKRIKRMELEKKYEETLKKYHEKVKNTGSESSVVKAGKWLTTETLKKIGTAVLVPTATGLVVYGIKKAAFKKHGRSDEKEPSFMKEVFNNVGARVETIKPAPAKSNPTPKVRKIKINSSDTQNLIDQLRKANKK